MDLATPSDALSHARGATDTPLIEQTLGDFFAAMARRQPAREALVSRHQGLRYTYAELYQEARRLASARRYSNRSRANRLHARASPPVSRIKIPIAATAGSRVPIPTSVTTTAIVTHA